MWWWNHRWTPENAPQSLDLDLKCIKPTRSDANLMAFHRKNKEKEMVSYYDGDDGQKQLQSIAAATVYDGGTGRWQQ